MPSARAGSDRLLPMMRPGSPDGAAADGESDGRRLEALLGLFYQDLKSELDALRRDTDAIREVVEGGRDVSWLETVEVEPDGNGAEAPAADRHRAQAEAPEITLAELEREAIARSLAAHQGNRRHAARALGIGERTLYRKLKEYHLT
ncbi:MAG: helix-turn-helix domain-containing protein [Gemmatimonadota bacterium]